MNSKFLKNTTEKIMHAAEEPSTLGILVTVIISITDFENVIVVKNLLNPRSAVNLYLPNIPIFPIKNVRKPLVF